MSRVNDEVNISTTRSLSQISYTAARWLGTERHLIGIEESRSSRQLFLIVTTTAGITVLLLSDHIFVVQCQRVSGHLNVSDAAEEIRDGSFVEVAVKQVGSHGHMTDALARWTHLHCCHSNDEILTQLHISV